MPINSFLYPGAKFTPPYEVANSVRLNGADSPRLHKTQSAGNRRTFTISWWMKRSALSASQSIIGSDPDASHGNNYFILDFNSSDQLDINGYESGATLRLITNRVFRDVSAWYHFVVAVDTTQGTAANRVRLYVNGTEETSFGTETDPSQNYETKVNENTNIFNIGGRSGAYVNGYMAEICFIDGSQLTASSFGEFDDDSPTIWKPKDVSGLTFGTNGFYLDFEDSSNLGNDVNGGTDLTEVNLAAADQATDTPTNNFCTLNPLNNWEGSYTLTEGSCIFTGTGGNDATAGTMGVVSGKWYFEAEFDSYSEACYAGFGPDTLLNKEGTGNPITSFIGMYRDDYTIQIGGSSEGAYTDVSDGDIFGFAINLDAASGSQTVIIQKNGSTIDTVTIPTANEGAFWIPVVGDTSSTDGVLKCNFGGCPSVAPSSAVADANGYGSFEYNPTISSVDYLALCSKNLGSNG